MMIFKSAFIWLLGLALCLLFAGTVISEEFDLEDIIAKAQNQQAKIEEEIRDATFMGESVYKERKKDEKISREIISNRRIYMKRGGKRRDDYFSMIINGEKLNDGEMKKEVKKWSKRSKSVSETKIPLSQETVGDYDYRLIGSDVLNGLPAWVLGFEAKKEEDGYINGKIYVSKDSFDILRVDFRPVKTSRVIKDMEMSLFYSPVEGYWMPAKFEMEMKIKVSFLLYRHITVEDTYSEYSFNNMLEDSIFAVE